MVAEKGKLSPLPPPSFFPHRRPHHPLPHTHLKLYSCGGLPLSCVLAWPAASRHNVRRGEPGDTSVTTLYTNDAGVRRGHSSLSLSVSRAQSSL